MRKGGDHISTRRDGIETKKKILTVCVRLFLEQGYKRTTITRIVEEAGVARGSFQNLFPTKDAVLMELVGTMFGGQFGVARSITDEKLPPVYTYAVETAIQLTLTELKKTSGRYISKPIPFRKRRNTSICTPRRS